jgi:hypothetical protein
MIETSGLSLVALERRLERAISDYLAVSRAGAVYAHPAARDQAEADAWDRMMDARAEMDAQRDATSDGAGSTQD